MGAEAEMFGGPTVSDGQHRSGHDMCNLHVEIDGYRMIYDHMVASGCLPNPIPADYMIPMSFTSDRNSPGVLTVYCAVCKKELGTCKGEAK